MKKILSTLFLVIASVAAMARSYTGTYVVTMDGAVVQEATETVYVTETAPNTYTLEIHNLVLGTIQVGNIAIPGIKTTEASPYYEEFSMDTTVTINKGDLDGMWIGPSLGKVPVTVYGKINEEKLYANIDMTVMGKSVNVTFGGDEGFTEGGSGDQWIEATRSYTDMYVVTMNGAIVQEATETVYIVETAPNTYTLEIENLVLGTIQVGNIVVPGIETYDSPSGNYEEFSINTTVTIEKGDLGGMWIGPSLGQVPITVYGKINEEKLYVNLDMTVMGKSVNVRFGTDDFQENIGPGGYYFEIRLKEDQFTYTGEPICPEWELTSSNINLSETDCEVTYSDNLYPGTGTIYVSAYGYTCYMEFTIGKAFLSEYDFRMYNIPEGEYVAGEYIPSPEVYTRDIEGVGNCSLSYVRKGTQSSDSVSSEMPLDEGNYNIYLYVTEGKCYHSGLFHLGSFSISLLTSDEWSRLNALHTELVEQGWENPWDISKGKTSVSSFHGVETENGSVVGLDLSSQGLTGTFPKALLSFPNIISINLSGNRLSGDVAAEIRACIEQDSVDCRSINSLDISNNSYSGNVGILAGCFPNLTALDASGNSFSSVSPMISANVSELNLASQQLDGVIDFGQMTDVPEILLYDHANQTFRSEMPLILTTAMPSGFDVATTDEWYANLLWSGNGFKANGNSRNNIYRGGNGDMIYAILDNDESVANGSSIGMTFTFESGDANIVNGTDVTDLQTMILYMFNLLGGSAFNFTAADLYADDVITVQDIVCVVNRILAQSATPGSSMMKASRHFEEDAEAYVYIKDGKVILDTEVPVAALSIKSDGGIEWNLQQLGMEQAVLGGNVVGYSLSGATLPVGETVIGTCVANTTLNGVMLADESATAICTSLGVGGGTTSIEYTTVDENGDCEFYNAAGVRHGGLSRGINLIKSNGKVKKVLNNK